MGNCLGRSPQASTYEQSNKKSASSSHSAATTSFAEPNICTSETALASIVIGTRYSRDGSSTPSHPTLTTCIKSHHPAAHHAVKKSFGLESAADDVVLKSLEGFVDRQTNSEMDMYHLSYLSTKAPSSSPSMRSVHPAVTTSCSFPSVATSPDSSYRNLPVSPFNTACMVPEPFNMAFIPEGCEGQTSGSCLYPRDPCKSEPPRQDCTTVDMRMYASTSQHLLQLLCPSQSSSQNAAFPARCSRLNPHASTSEVPDCPATPPHVPYTPVSPPTTPDEHNSHESSSFYASLQAPLQSSNLCWQRSRASNGSDVLTPTSSYSHLQPERMSPSQPGMMLTSDSRLLQRIASVCESRMSNSFMRALSTSGVAQVDELAADLVRRRTTFCGSENAGLSPTQSSSQIASPVSKSKHNSPTVPVCGVSAARPPVARAGIRYTASDVRVTGLPMDELRASRKARHTTSLGPRSTITSLGSHACRRDLATTSLTAPYASESLALFPAPSSDIPITTLPTQRRCLESTNREAANMANTFRDVPSEPQAVGSTAFFPARPVVADRSTPTFKAAATIAWAASGIPLLPSAPARLCPGKAQEASQALIHDAPPGAGDALQQPQHPAVVSTAAAASCVWGTWAAALTTDNSAHTPTAATQHPMLFTTLNTLSSCELDMSTQAELSGEDVGDDDFEPKYKYGGFGILGSLSPREVHR